MTRRFVSLHLWTHVANKLRRESRNVFEHAHGPLERSIALGIEDRIVDYDSIYALVAIGKLDLVFESFWCNFS